MSRAVPAQDVTPMTMMIVTVEPPRTVASTIANGRNGITRNQSVSRCSGATQPVVVAGGDADRRPDEHGDQGGGDADGRDTRAPTPAVPAWSGPSRRCPARTPRRRVQEFTSGLVTLMVSGGNRTGARMAAMMKKTRMPSPSIPARWVRNCANWARASAAGPARCRPCGWSATLCRLLVAGHQDLPRVDHGVEQVGHEVGQHDPDGEEQEDGLQQGHVRAAAGHRTDSSPRPGQEKTVSTVIAPDTNPRFRKMRGDGRQQQVPGTACRRRTMNLSTALRGPCEVVLVHLRP